MSAPNLDDHLLRPAGLFETPEMVLEFGPTVAGKKDHDEQEYRANHA
ncbi:hypothetical protein [Mesorhizobium sp.]|nr:hypothetical protein [Mesorhizobium sp.]